MTTPARIFLLFALLLAITASSRPPLNAEETAYVGLVLARTGVAKSSDHSGWLAAQLAIEDINRSGGIAGRSLELIALDNQSTPLGAMQAAKTAVELDVIAVIGAGWSSHSLPMAKVLQRARIPMITPSATHPQVTRTGTYIFRVCFTDSFQGGALAGFAYDDLEASSSVVLRNVSESYSMDLAQHYTQKYQSLGGTVLWQGDYKSKTADFTAILEKVRDLRPQVVFIPGYEQDSGMILRQASHLGVKAQFLGGDGWGRDILRLAGDAANGAYYLSQWHPQMPSSRIRELVQRFRARFPEADYSSLMLPMTYDSFHLLADAARRAGCLDRPKIRNALAATRQFEGVSGRLSFDAHGDPVARSAIILKIDQAKIHIHKTINFP